MKEFKIGNIFRIKLTPRNQGGWRLDCYLINGLYPFWNGFNAIYKDIVYSDSEKEARAKVFDFWREYRHQFKHYLY